MSFTAPFRELLIAGLLVLALPVQAATATKPAKIAPAATATAKPPASATDSVNLETSTIRGQQALPKVLNIVPWKRAGAGGLPDRPGASLLDDVLAPLDRGELRRQLRYQRDIDAESAQAAAGKPVQQTKKE